MALSVIGVTCALLPVPSGLLIYGQMIEVVFLNSDKSKLSEDLDDVKLVLADFAFYAGVLVAAQ